MCAVGVAGGPINGAQCVKFVLGCLLAGLLASAVHGGEAGTRHLYGIAGETYGGGSRYPAILYRIENGDLVKVRTIVTTRQGAEFIHAFPERGYVLVLSYTMGYGTGTYILDVLDLSSMSSYVRHEIDACEDCSHITAGNRLLDRGGQLILRIKSVRDDASYHTAIDVATGEIVDDLMDGEWVDLRRGIDTNSWYGKHRRFYDWRAIYEVRDTTGWRDESYEALSDERYTPFPATWRHTRESAIEGHAPLPSPRERFQIDQTIPTGKLNLYNVLSKQEIAYDTGVPDSEVLLVDDNDIAYLRLADELWRAQITGDGLEDMRKIAKSRILQNVHWLVLGYE